MYFISAYRRSAQLLPVQTQAADSALARDAHHSSSAAAAPGRTGTGCVVRNTKK